VKAGAASTYKDAPLRTQIFDEMIDIVGPHSPICAFRHAFHNGIVASKRVEAQSLNQIPVIATEVDFAVTVHD
jgi:hypothetical protein